MIALLVALTLGQAAEPSRAERLLHLHRSDAETYTIYRDAGRKETLELRKEPVYRWTNPTRNGGQEGDVFVWTFHGRPEVVGCVFSHPEQGDQRVVNHEFHSLSPKVLIVDHPGQNSWEPKAPGVDWTPIEGAPVPAATANARRIQINALARDFVAESHLNGPPVTLRLLNHPLYRYESTDPDILDGALFAYVTSAGTDPEILLVIEAHKDDTGKPRYFFSGARFSAWALRLKSKSGKIVWESAGAAIGGYAHDEQHRYRFYNEKKIAEIVPPLSQPK